MVFTTTLSNENVIQALANYLYDNGYLPDEIVDGTMSYVTDATTGSVDITIVSGKDANN